MDKILILDFGSQVTQLIARRVREAGVYCELHPCDVSDAFIRGYGAKGMRVFDFGWVVAARGWAPGEQAMRLQMHATDPDRLEPRLGRRESKGCIRIPATLNRLIDHHGLLDADYEAAPPGRPLWVLKPDRDPTPWSGRWLVVVDSGRSARPDWALPLAAAESAAPAQAALASCGAPGCSCTRASARRKPSSKVSFGCVLTKSVVPSPRAATTRMPSSRKAWLSSDSRPSRAAM